MLNFRKLFILLFVLKFEMKFFRKSISISFSYVKNYTGKICCKRNTGTTVYLKGLNLISETIVRGVNVAWFTATYRPYLRSQFLSGRKWQLSQLLLGIIIQTQINSTFFLFLQTQSTKKREKPQTERLIFLEINFEFSTKLRFGTSKICSKIRGYSRGRGLPSKLESRQSASNFTRG